jgi:hypothetical protein
MADQSGNERFHGAPIWPEEMVGGRRSTIRIELSSGAARVALVRGEDGVTRVRVITPTAEVEILSVATLPKG